MAGSILDAQGNWTAEEGCYKKSELCREHDLDVRRNELRYPSAEDPSLETCASSTRSLPISCP